MISALFGLALGWLRDTIQARDLSPDSAVVWFGVGAVVVLVLTASALYGATVVATTRRARRMTFGWIAALCLLLGVLSLTVAVAANATDRALETVVTAGVFGTVSAVYGCWFAVIWFRPGEDANLDNKQFWHEGAIDNTVAIGAQLETLNGRLARIETAVDAPAPTRCASCRNLVWTGPAWLGRILARWIAPSQ